MENVVVFDLDGVLVDTQDMIRAAYLEAGIVAPDRVLDLEGSGWLLETCAGDEGLALDVWLKKNEIYTRLIANDALAPLLPPFAVACQLFRDGFQPYVMTAAPSTALDALHHRLDMWPFYGSWGGLRTGDKMVEIRQRVRTISWGAGVYVDDQHKHINLPDDWRFVRYVGQSATRLYEDVAQSRRG